MIEGTGKVNTRNICYINGISQSNGLNEVNTSLLFLFQTNSLSLCESFGWGTVVPTKSTCCIACCLSWPSSVFILCGIDIIFLSFCLWYSELFCKWVWFCGGLIFLLTSATFCWQPIDYTITSTFVESLTSWSI